MGEKPKRSQFYILNMDPFQIPDRSVAEIEVLSDGITQSSLQSGTRGLNQPGAFHEGVSRNSYPLEPGGCQNADAVSDSKSKLKRTRTDQQAAAGAGDVKAKKARVEDPTREIPDAVFLETCAKLQPILVAKQENEKIIEKAKAAIKRLEARSLEVMRSHLANYLEVMKSHLANNKADNVYLDCTANVTQVGAGLPQNAPHADPAQSPKSQSSGSDGDGDGGPECGAGARAVKALVRVDASQTSLGPGTTNRFTSAEQRGL
ncbi:uncharacterized protein LOC125427722 [Sphaerodactylus townsendi]|uniref:uncharacterized protein LOC125427722 n=1 Tax=Sphaerodactylus townsendi TaxID=933632 RepID=UPI002026C179|nr:uncharacterized protein LOC125427722 [Sphaerodactylus townsendi]